MRFPVLIAVVASLFLTACEPDGIGDQIARQQAKDVVNRVVDRQFPGANVAPVTDCIIDNASGSEIIQIASASVTGIDQKTTNLVVEIALRPRTIECAAENALPLILRSR
ncbi:succinate dehydrogenase [Parasulfitobacter algicola]|uniref:Succinate dehydrogenase n=1 Tax=Parasulfitobacter algicola TaxID=2614809 RepID=A0ABX2ISZ5_9RHOB|nr:succinate dehydrogenase [Sulfitobacter algicola]NSX53183.1 succinate dehydrogenase [Sulfitobacter algicola]